MSVQELFEAIHLFNMVVMLSACQELGMLR